MTGQAAQQTQPGFGQDARSYLAASSQADQARRAFHTRLPGYEASPLTRATPLAERLGLGEVWVKDESSRYGLPSFKILGASWATYHALRQAVGFADADWTTVDELADLVRSGSRIRRLAAATDGNHGRAVARVARWLGMESTIIVPTGTAAARTTAIEREGATVLVVDGGYGDAIARSAEEASPECLVVSDTSWPGYQEVPQQVVEGYRTIFEEADGQLRQEGAAAPDVIVVQVGVGALAGAAVRHYRAPGRDPAPRLVAVEPVGAASTLASITSGQLATIPGPHPSIMVGLNCDTPSLVAWPDVSQGIDVFLAVDDDAARRAMRDLASVAVVSGETGAAGYAGLTELCRGTARELWQGLQLGEDASVLVLSTEGATDPDAYAEIVGAAVPTTGRAR